VTRRRTGRDASLTVRTIVVACALALAYAALVASSVLLAVSQWDRSPLLTFVPALVGFLIFLHFQLADSLVLTTSRARVVDRSAEPTLHTVVERLSGMAGISPPRVAVSPVLQANALATGLTPARSTIAVTSELRARLTDGELEAVVAHELCHIANRDSIVLTAATFFRTVAGVLDPVAMGTSRGDPFEETWIMWAAWLVLAPVRWVLLACGTIFTFALSRYREYAADRGAAFLTGSPGQLMSALVKLSDPERIPAKDLRRLDAVETLCIVPTREHKLAFLQDHPPLEKRLARLAAMARELGKPLGP
jgi:heat shock protein HtpX